MKAKDTVIKLNRGGILSDIEVDYYNNGAEAQAEPSFKAGEQESDRKWRQILRDSMTMAKLAGRREVVKWIEKHHWEESSVPGYIDYGFNEIPWQVKLKEWGIDETIIT